MRARSSTGRGRVRCAGGNLPALFRTTRREPGVAHQILHPVRVRGRRRMRENRSLAGCMGSIMRYGTAKTLGDSRAAWIPLALALCLVAFAFASMPVCCSAQENPLDNVQTPAPPPPPKSPEEQKPLIEGADNVAAQATSHRDARLRIDVNLVQVPLTVTDPMNRLVTGLEKDNFVLYDKPKK